MANLSAVYGTMQLIGDWTPDMVDNLNILLDEWRQWSYNIDAEAFAEDHLTSEVCANGRWSFDANLESLGKWTTITENETVKKAYADLCGELRNKVDENGDPTAFIQVDFSEEEGGCEILREASGQIIVRDGELAGIITSNQDYEYTKENLVKLNFYDSVEDIDWLDDESGAQM